jgi:hypothetical protein
MAVVLARLYDRATILLFDIPPQLYVANQYLAHVFGDRVVPYRQAVALDIVPAAGVPSEVRGKIVIPTAWRLPSWADVKIDVFWNIASFQEMEPDVVSNYLALIRRMNPEWIYINAKPQGALWGEWRPGRGGTKEPVLADTYFEAIGTQYALEREYFTEYFLRDREYKSYVFARVR